MSEANKSRLPLWLVASLLVNALLIGLLIGGGLGRATDSDAGGLPGNEQTLIRGMDRVVPGEQRTEVRRAFQRGYSETRHERRQLRLARRDLSRLLTADIYDEESVRAGFERLRDAESAMKARLHEVLTEQLGTLTKEQRRLVIRDLTQRDPRRGDRDRRPPPSRPGD